MLRNVSLFCAFLNYWVVSVGRASVRKNYGLCTLVRYLAPSYAFYGTLHATLLRLSAPFKMSSPMAGRLKQALRDSSEGLW